MYLKTPNDVTRAHRPSRMTMGTQLMFGILNIQQKSEDYFFTLSVYRKESFQIENQLLTEHTRRKLKSQAVFYKE